MKVIIIGAGWAGCAAASITKKLGAEVHLYEKTDLLLGLGNVGGIMRNNGRFTASEELINMGAGELIKITDKVARHVNVHFPGHKHATLYDVNKIEYEVNKYLKSIGVNIYLMTRIVDVEKEGDLIKGVYDSEGDFISGDVFIECTGSTGPMGNCLKYGNGCSMCILRCPSFGPRVSISQRAGVDDVQGERADDIYGAFSGSCKLSKDTLSKDIVENLDKEGVVVLKIPKEDVNLDKLKSKVCQQYALKEFAENIVLLDTGHAKLMTTYYPLEKLRKIKGLEKVKFIDPYAGGKGNSIRYLAVTPRDNSMKVQGISNLFVAGEKSGLFVGHTEAICTGTLAGYNSLRYASKLEPFILSEQTSIGDMIKYANYKFMVEKDMKTRFTFAGSVYFNRMKEKGLYITDSNEIEDKIKKLGLKNVFTNIM